MKKPHGKRLLSMTICAVLALSMLAIFPATARAEAKVVTEGAFTFSYENNTMTISGTGSLDSIPWDLYGTMDNTGFFPKVISFPKETDLHRVVIENGITGIGSYVFQECEALESVSLPEALTSIGERAFDSTGLKSIDLPDSLQTIGNFAFWDTNIESLTIPANVETIGQSAFESNTSLTSVTFADGCKVKTMTDAAIFRYCSSLTDVKLHEGLESIEGNSVFSDCPALKNLTLPKSLIYLSPYTFNNGSADVNLDSITILNKNLVLDLTTNDIRGTSEKKTIIYSYHDNDNAKTYADIEANYCTFVPIDHEVSCNVAKADTGTLTADIGYAIPNEKVTFTATPAAGYKLSKITVTPESGETVTLTKAPYEYTMPAVAVGAVATFVNAYSITCETNNTTYGTITADPASIAVGETVTFTAAPQTGYELEKIEVKYLDGSTPTTLATLYPDDPSYTLPSAISAASITASASFKAKDYNVNITTPTNGTLTVPAGTAAYNSQVTFTATPAEGYKLTKITITPEGGTAVESTTSPYVYTMPAADVTATAEFTALPTYNVVITPPEHGTLTADKSAMYEDGKVTFTATPEKGYKLIEITVTPEGGGPAVGSTTSPYEYTMPAANVTATATFELRDYQISATVSTSGEINLSASSAKTGEVVTVEAVAAKNFILDSITAKCEGKTIAIADDGTFTMPSGDVVVEAVYSPLKFLTGENQKWKTGSSSGAEFSTNGIYESFSGIQIDGTDVDSSNYTSKKGSTIINLGSTYLNTLKTGKHTLTVQYSDGSAVSTGFTISTKSTGVDTGDDFSPILFALIANIFGFSAMATYYFFPGFRKKKNEQ